MENNYFYKKFQKKADSELERILNDTKSYTEDAVIAATQLLKERQVELSEEQKSAVEIIETRIEEKKVIEEVRKKETELSPVAKRIIALLIDLAILSGLSYLTGFLLIGTPLVKTPWEPILSMIIILGYFAVFNSSIGKKTIGKNVMHIKVVDYNFQSLKFTNSLVRYSLLIAPFFLLNILDNMSFNSFGILSGLRYAYYIGIFYFLITDKERRRSFHDLITKSFVSSENSEKTNFVYPNKKLKTYYFIASGIIALFIILNLSSRLNTTNNMSDFEAQAEQLEKTLNENMTTFESIISDIQEIDGVAEIEGISLNTTNGITSLDITIRPSSFFANDGLTSEVYESLKGKELRVNRLDNVKIKKHYGFDMTLASFNRTETKNFEQ
ncbi:RDD family protein [Echinicola sp. 20G]|uniref:RDD family protein n=1 Tax=Echinicola sp. 20G TaxID=2781961 RepID=UPI0019111E2A|nr:RDD family protein [Echinicola sp. 20G]